MTHPLLLDPNGDEYEVEYPFDVVFKIYDSAIVTCKQVWDVHGAPNTDRDTGAKEGKRGRKSTEELNNDTTIQMLAGWVAGQYGHDESEIGYINPEDATYVVMGELQLDHCRLTYNTDEGKGAEIMENLQNRQTARVNKVVRTANAAGPSETKEAPAPRPKGNGNGKSGKAVPPTVKAPAKANKTETKAAAPKKSAKPAKVVAKPAKAAKPVKSAPKAAAKKVAAAPAAKRGRPAKAAPAKPVKAVAKGKAAPATVGANAGGRTPENQAAIQYIKDNLIKGWPHERIINAINTQARFKGTNVARNPQKAIYRQQSALYVSGEMIKPEGSRGRVGTYEVPKKKRGRK